MYELDLKVNKMRYLKSIGSSTPGHEFSSHTPRPLFVSKSGIPLPQYIYHALTVRILIEALVQLSRLDDVKTMISEQVEGELMGVVELKQAKTLVRF